MVDRPELDGALNENGMMRFNEYRLTLKGLQNDNRRERWMKDRKLAEEMQSLARMRAEWVRDNWDTEQCREFIAGLQ